MVQTPVSNQSTAWLRLVGALLVRVNLSTSPEEISCENGILRCSAEQVSSIRRSLHGRISNHSVLAMLR